MSLIGKIKVKNLKDLQQTPQPPAPAEIKLDLKRTPSKRQTKRAAAEDAEALPPLLRTPTKSSRPGVSGIGTSPAKINATARNFKKEPPPNQKRIDNFFKSCSKTFSVEPEAPQTTAASLNGKENHKKEMNSSTKNRTKRRSGGTRKMIKRSYENDSTSSETDSTDSSTPSKVAAASVRKRKTPSKRTPHKKTPQKAQVFIDLCSESEEDQLVWPVKEEEPLIINAATPPSGSISSPPSSPTYCGAYSGISNSVVPSSPDPIARSQPKTAADEPSKAYEEVAPTPDSSPSPKNEKSCNSDASSDWLS